MESMLFGQSAVLGVPGISFLPQLCLFDLWNPSFIQRWSCNSHCLGSWSTLCENCLILSKPKLFCGCPLWQCGRFSLLFVRKNRQCLARDFHTTQYTSREGMENRNLVLLVECFCHCINKVILACKFTPFREKKKKKVLPLQAPSSVTRYVSHTDHCSGMGCYTGTAGKCHLCFVGFWFWKKFQWYDSCVCRKYSASPLPLPSLHTCMKLTLPIPR